MNRLYGNCVYVLTPFLCLVLSAHFVYAGQVVKESYAQMYKHADNVFEGMVLSISDKECSADKDLFIQKYCKQDIEIDVFSVLKGSYVEGQVVVLEGAEYYYQDPLAPSSCIMPNINVGEKYIFVPYDKKISLCGPNKRVYNVSESKRSRFQNLFQSIRNLFGLE